MQISMIDNKRVYPPRGGGVSIEKINFKPILRKKLNFKPKMLRLNSGFKVSGGGLE